MHIFPGERKSFLFFVTFMLVVMLSACWSNGPTIASDGIQAKTQKVEITLSPIPTNTLTPTPVPPTKTPTVTPTATFTPSPTPDVRVIIANPKEFLCQKSDLPPQGMYILPNSGWISPHHNYEIIQTWGKEEGQKYIDETGRIDGWWVYYLRTSNNAVLPEQIYCNPVQYKTVEGAYLSLTKYNYVARGEKGYSVVSDDVGVGEHSLALHHTGIDRSGNPYVVLIVDFQYRNYFITVGGIGDEREVKLDTLISIAQKVLSRLENAELYPPPAGE